ncbi:hypothetical protein MES4922_90139 [Mesorhizobium ventifaucium]|uniref:Transposase n=1 Tax=Mesorhizobium ventifaucium TaxID=666020 RepID=A0ABM9EFT8_9HYPH|nr:hypothetical protein MES4922_90139 [Mesorhizobium ventifaucium]
MRRQSGQFKGEARTTRGRATLDAIRLLMSIRRQRGPAWFVLLAAGSVAKPCDSFAEPA